MKQYCAERLKCWENLMGGMMTSKDSMEPFDFKPLEQDKQDEIVERIEAQLAGSDPESVRRAVLGLGWLESGEDFVEPLLKLAGSDMAELAQLALEGLARVGGAKAEEPLARLVLEQFRSPKPGHDEVRAEAIRCMGKVGGKNSVLFLEQLIANPAPANEMDKEAAVEAFVSLADKGVDGVADILKELTEKAAAGPLEESLQAALRELNVRQWDDKGYITIEAEVEDEDKGRTGGEK